MGVPNLMCPECGWRGDLTDCERFGDDLICPDCGNRMGRITEEEFCDE